MHNRTRRSSPLWLYSQVAQRLFGDSKEKADYINVATTVFTPLEYGCIGLAEEDALKIYGEGNIEVHYSKRE